MWFFLRKPAVTHYLQDYHNKEMILIKEVMANKHTHAHTHTPFSSHFLLLWHRVAVWGKIPASWYIKVRFILDLTFNVLNVELGPKAAYKRICSSPWITVSRKWKKISSHLAVSQSSYMKHLVWLKVFPIEHIQVETCSRNLFLQPLCRIIESQVEAFQGKIWAFTKRKIWHTAETDGNCTLTIPQRRKWETLHAKEMCPVP